ncbi:MAG: DegT/DnrJ/EryC1/StrS family aminotransferase [Candidatus Omnitrophica bacterium]|nr:DegT/DnrJ/EryC1/StrS family aminotransferase [Candidatus Omnitrophota bacterium]
MKKNFNIPLLDLKKEYSFLKKEIDQNIKQCLKSQQWILGKAVSDFEAKAEDYLGTKHALGVASGTDALILSLKALALKIKGKEHFDKKDEIITTPFTFIATAESIVHSGATPVFVDIDSESYNIDPLKIKKAINKNTVGIIPVHLYGLAANMSEITKLAKSRGLFVVEDTAQSFGAKFNGKQAGSLGDCGAFSFFPSKNLGAFGDGGLIATNDSKLFSFLTILRNHGQTSQYRAAYIGYNSRLDSMQAAVLLAKLKHINKFNDLRRSVAQKYNNAFKDIKELKIPSESKACRHVYHLYTLRISAKRDKLLNYLNSKGIHSRIYYPVCLHKMKAFKRVKISGKLKVAESMATRILSLPIHPWLTDRQINYVISTTRRFFNK